ncbi:hypothetical protein Tco_0331340 [Tanacetum coccineum]
MSHSKSPWSPTMEDEILLAEEQPPPAAASPTADSPGYLSESDPDMEPEGGTMRIPRRIYPLTLLIGYDNDDE